MENLEQLAEILSNLTVLECYHLVKIMKETYGIEPRTNIAPIPYKREIINVIEKTNFDVILKSIPENKLNVIRGIKDMTGMSLLDIKKLVESAPCKIKENVSKDESTALMITLRELGADVEID